VVWQEILASFISYFKEALKKTTGKELGQPTGIPTPISVCAHWPLSLPLTHDANRSRCCSDCCCSLLAGSVSLVLLCLSTTKIQAKNN
jgi:hypothetical protein